jgi:ubiquinone biosynthesis accessory factor UbiK
VSVKRSTHGSGTGHETGNQGEAGRIDPPSQRGERRMVNVQSIDDLARRLAALVPPGLKEARDDLAGNFKSALQSGLRELDLVTREEFDVQRCVLLRTREKIEELEAQVAHLEKALGTELPRPSH